MASGREDLLHAGEPPASGGDVVRFGCPADETPEAELFDRDQVGHAFESHNFTVVAKLHELGDEDLEPGPGRS